ncbi:MAG: hypothetical protein KAR06_10335 [Deltaproteobacteria bacterium]|nr:hypothetical protein [Deltaproteobacteria bacterium]
MKKIVLTIAIILAASAVYLSYWSSEKATDILGPSFVVENDEEETYLLFNHAIYKHDSNGKMLWVRKLSELGIKEKSITHIALDSNGYLLIGDANKSLIRRYTADGSPIGHINIKDESDTNIIGAFDFVEDEETFDIFVTDTRNHTIKVFDEYGEYKTSFGSKGASDRSFHFPNNITIGTDGLLYIADTNNHRVVIREKDGTLVRTIRTTESFNILGNVWPVFVSFIQENKLAVVNMGPELLAGELVIVDTQSGSLEKVELPGCDCVFSMLVSDSELIVTDAINFQVLRYSFEGEPLGAFGSNTLQSRLEEARSDKAKFESIASKVKYGLFALLPLLLIALALERLKKTNTAAEETPAPKSMACPKCFNQIDRITGNCPQCTRAPSITTEDQKKWAAPVLSILYPGLGQLKNGELRKGLVYISMFTLSLLPVGMMVHSYYNELAEVGTYYMKYSIMLLSFTWAASILDALRQSYWPRKETQPSKKT